MSASSLPALWVLSGLVASAASAAPVPSHETAESQLRAINHRFIDAGVDTSGDLIEALTHDDFLLTQADGAWLSRARFMAQVRQQPPLHGSRSEDLRVRLFGPVALAHGVFAAPQTGGTMAKLRYTDVYVWSGTAWRLVSSQDTALQGAAAVPLVTGASPAHAPWKEQDPSGDDAIVLHALNDHYVKAFREADVAWYDAHLAPDYVMVAGDGSFHDRAATLARFAQPTFATAMRSFPVGKVHVRRFADVALIHAENAFELKDGRQGVSRYTDIWHQREGRWVCIAAHTTVHKAPAMPAGEQVGVARSQGAAAR